MKKIIPVIVAFLLIFVIGGVTVAKFLNEKYAYSTERVKLAEYYQVEENSEELVIFLQNEIIRDRAILRDGVCYFPIDIVKKHFNDTFYVDGEKKKVLYTDALGITEIPFDALEYETPEGKKNLGHAAVLETQKGLYLAEDFLRGYANYSLVIAQYHVMLNTEFGKINVATVTKDSAIRAKGGIKSSIVWDVKEGDKVTVLEKMENWSKVLTQDGYAGYIENKQLKDEKEEMQEEICRFQEPEYPSFGIDGKVSLGWHSIGAVGGNDTLESMVAQTRGMNVIAPTWFSLTDNEGGFESFGTASYVERAHNMGLLVWGVLDDFNYRNVNKANIDDTLLLSKEESRRRLIDGIVAEAVKLKLDGINLDFEKLQADGEEAFGQFLRELSLKCKEHSLTLSVDNYVPFQFNNYYRRDIQGKVADYVIIMGYDEHWHGSGEPGSVASIDYVSNGIDRTLEQVPKEKVVNALPFYSIVWKVEGNQVTDEYLTLANTDAFLARIGVPAQWDETTGQDYAEWESGAAKYMLWAETPESLSVKLNVMKTKEIAGVAVWQIGYGTPEAWALIEAYASTK